MAVNRLVSLLRTTTGTEPVTVDEFKRFVRMGLSPTGTVIATSEDTLIATMAKAARQLIEKKLGIALVVSTFIERYSSNCETITLSYAPVTAVSSVYEFNSALLLQSNKELLTLNSDYSVQDDVILTSESLYGLEINYTAGYTPAKIPDSLKEMVLRQTSFMFDNRNMDSELDLTVKIMGKAYTRNYF